jgi:hypothetical protein
VFKNLVDPAIHNSNTLQFRGRPLGLSSGGAGYELGLGHGAAVAAAAQA